jgi:hypothetical protein
MRRFGRAQGALAGCRPEMWRRPGMWRRVIRAPARHRHRALPALPATTANRWRHRALIAVLVAGPTGPFTARVMATPGAVLAALQRFLLAYSGVFALVALTAAVAAGLAAADRLVMSPGRRVAFQAVHRALSLAAVGFLASHVLLEILAHRSRAIDAVVPFLASGRTVYLGLGTLASDLVLLIAMTGVARGRFAARRTVIWRAVHLTAYLGWPLAILHGLLGGRPAKPYVDWSYGACVAAVAAALVVRLVAPRRGRAGAVPDPAPGLPGPSPPAYLLAAPPPATHLPVHPPARRALPGGIHDGGTQYGVVYGVVDDGAPDAPETP